MKLINRTKIDDSILTSLLVRAGRSVHARTDEVLVIVRQGRTFYCSGVAHRCYRVRVTSRWINVDGGYFEISMPDPGTRRDPILLAEKFLETARHEFGHIYDYQNPGPDKPFSRASARSGRRPAHDKRPEEIRVGNYIYDSDRRIESNYFENVILALALAIEARQRDILV